MTLWFPKIECPRGLGTCRSYGQIVSDDEEPMKGSFFCCGKHDGTMAPVQQDIYTKCFHGEFRDDIRFYDRRDLVDEMSVIATALSHIELDMMSASEEQFGDSTSEATE